MNCPKCRGPLQQVSLPDGAEIESCPYCGGVFYDLADLTLDLAVENLMASRFACPKCGGAMKAGTVFEGKLVLESCGQCPGVWLDQGEVQKLRQLSGKDKVVGRRGTRDVDAPPAPKPEPAALSDAGAAGLVPAAPERRADASVQEFGKQLSGGLGKPKSENAPVLPPDCGAWNNPDIAANPCVVHDDRTFAHFQTSKPAVSYVLGEFNWKVAVGDLAVARDFVSPPFIISEDKTEEDTAWSVGEYLEPGEIWEAFKMEGEPPPRIGTAPAQPNPHEDDWSSMAPLFARYLAATLVLFGLAAIFSQHGHVKTFDLRYDVADTEKSRVTDSFQITGRTSNVRVRLDTDLDNKWAYLAMALINANTDEALDFGREVGYYHGVEDGESWSEGSRSDTVFLPSVKAGSYYLRVEPETDASGISYRVELTRDVARISYLFYAWLLLGLPVLWVWFLRRGFEVSRWAESDHPWVKESDDDDDDDDD